MPASLSGDFRGGCCDFEGERDGTLYARPHTPDPVTGRQWFAFIARLNGPPGTYRIGIQWPPTNPRLEATMEYGATDPFASVLHRIIHVSRNLMDWHPVDNVVVENDTAYAVVNKPGEPFYIAAGMPWLRESFDALMDEVKASGIADVITLATSDKGHPVPLVRLGRGGGAEGAFHLQALQHGNEWGGGRALAAAVRLLLSDEGAELRERFNWHIVPCVNVDALDGWQFNPPINMNRDWTPFERPEMRAIRDHIQSIQRNGETLLHALDLHMGWARKDNAESSLTVFADPGSPPQATGPQVAFGRFCQERLGFTDYLWHVHHKNGTSFARWMWQEHGIPAQTVEISRHLWLDKQTRQWVAMRQHHEEFLGRGLIQALAAFDWKC